MLIADQFYRPPLRVIFMTPGLAPGGAEVWLSTLVERAQRVDYRGIITADADDWTNRDFTLKGVPINRANCEANMQDMLREVWKDGVDLVVYWGIGHKLDQFQKFNVPFISVSHASVVDNSPPGHRKFMDLIGENHCHFMAAVSQSAAMMFSQELRDRDNVTVIHSGVDVEKTRPVVGREEQRRRWHIPPDAKVILYVGRFYDGKGADVALQAFREFDNNHYLILNGWGQDERDLKNAAHRAFSSNNGTGRVIFPQAQTRSLGDVYAAADLVVIPSRTEALPLVLLEAWQSGTPVVASEFATIGELEKVYNNGKPLVYGIPCPPSAKDLVTGIRMAFDHPNDNIRDDAFQLAMTEFTASAMVGRWESYFYHCRREWMRIGEQGYWEMSLPMERQNDSDNRLLEEPSSSAPSIP